MSTSPLDRTPSALSNIREGDGWCPPASHGMFNTRGGITRKNSTFFSYTISPFLYASVCVRVCACTCLLSSLSSYSSCHHYLSSPPSTQPLPIITTTIVISQISHLTPHLNTTQVSHTCLLPPSRPLIVCVSSPHTPPLSRGPFLPLLVLGIPASLETCKCNFVITFSSLPSLLQQERGASSAARHQYRLPGRRQCGERLQ